MNLFDCPAQLGGMGTAVIIAFFLAGSDNLCGNITVNSGSF
jgi:hypothetical protein